MDDLMTWWRGVLDESETAIVYYRDGHPGEPCTNSVEDDPAGEHYDRGEPCERHLRAVAGSQYYDARFGLAQVRADRRILDGYATHKAQIQGAGPAFEAVVRTLADVVKIRAEAYSNHPGYREEWRANG